MTSPLQGAAKVVDRSRLEAEVERARSAGQRVVFTNGCFDVLHVGHVRYLQQARGLGNLLVVGVNSDRSVRELKGPDRPLNPEDERAEVIAALECVDLVCVFDEKRPDNLIRIVRPAVHAKGGDYRVEDLPEAALVRSLGGEVVILPLVPGRSTSLLLERASGTRVS